MIVNVLFVFLYNCKHSNGLQRNLSQHFKELSLAEDQSSQST